MVDINWVQIGVGFIVGVGCVWLVSDLVFPMKDKK
jgi:hypothetical protein